MQKMKNVVSSKKCSVCSSTLTINVINFKPSPLGDVYLPFKKRKLSKYLYPLNLFLCKKCGYLFLKDKVNPKISYQNYIYESKTTVGLESHYDDYAKDIIKVLKLKASTKVLDIGSNDGSMLNSFKKLGLGILGVEPASEIAKMANKNGLKTINGYLDRAVKNKILIKHGKYNLITANYVFANILNINKFLANVYEVLSDDGNLIIQTGYHPRQFKINMFDYVYHEHFSYFSLKTLKILMSKHNLKLIDADLNNKKGGSIRVIFSKDKNSKCKTAKIKKIIDSEKSLNINTLIYFKKLELEIEYQKNNSLKFLDDAKDSGKIVVGIGASHSVATLIYHFELNKYFDFLVDDNKKKHNLYSPGLNLKVKPVSFAKKKPDYIYILAWQHQNTILKRYAHLRKQGIKFIIPLPKFKIL